MQRGLEQLGYDCRPVQTVWSVFAPADSDRRLAGAQRPPADLLARRGSRRRTAVKLAQEKFANFLPRELPIGDRGARRGQKFMKNVGLSFLAGCLFLTGMCRRRMSGVVRRRHGNPSAALATMNYDPVCGETRRGRQTYGNACEAGQDRGQDRLSRRMSF